MPTPEKRAVSEKQDVPKTKEESPEAVLAAQIEKTARRRAGYTRRFFKREGIEGGTFVEALKKDPYGIEVNFEDDASLALGVHELQKVLGFPKKDSSKGCDGKFGKLTYAAFRKVSVRAHARALRTGDEEAMGLVKTSPAAGANPAQEPTAVPASESVSSSSPEGDIDSPEGNEGLDATMGNLFSKYADLIKYKGSDPVKRRIAKALYRYCSKNVKEKCETFAAILTRGLREIITGEKTRHFVFRMPIARPATAALRGIKVRDLTPELVRKYVRPGMVFFVNSPRRHKGRNKIVPGTSHKLPRISDKRHWFTLTHFDSSGEPVFADNGGTKGLYLS